MHIPAGYQIQFSTYEGDGDNPELLTLSGLSKEDVKFYVELSGYFSNEAGGYYANDVITPQDLITIINKTITNHPEVSDWKILNDDEDDIADEYYEKLCDDMLGNAYDVGRFFCRCIDSIKIYFFETEIKDLSHQFIK